jgi:IrrE N-terminal-like domain
MELPKEVTIAPELLLQLRTAYNGSLAVHVEKTGYSDAEISEWEKTGKKIPSKVIASYQAEYKKPIAFFLLPELPAGKIKPKKLRTHKNIPIDKFTRETILEVDKIVQRVGLLEDAQLLEGKTEVEKLPFSSTAKVFALTIRKGLGVESLPSRNRNWLKYWVDHIESVGVLVSQTSLQKKLDGFLLISEKDVATIVLNSSEQSARRLFTLAHELGHLLLAKHGSKASYEAEEKFCNSFAGNLLIPRGLLLESETIQHYLGNGFPNEDLKSGAWVKDVRTCFRAIN